MTISMVHRAWRQRAQALGDPPPRPITPTRQLRMVTAVL